MATTCISVVFDSELTKAKAVLRDIMLTMKKRFPYISDSDLFDLRLVYSGLLHNAIIHGNKEDVSKKVELIVVIEQDSIFSIIRDEGRGFDVREALLKTRRTEDLLCETGRGLLIVSKLTESLSFNQTGNTIEFQKKLSNNFASA